MKLNELEFEAGDRTLTISNINHKGKMKKLVEAVDVKIIKLYDLYNQELITTKDFLLQVSNLKDKVFDEEFSMRMQELGVSEFDILRGD